MDFTAWLSAFWTIFVLHYGLVFTLAIPIGANLLAHSSWSSTTRAQIAAVACILVGGIAVPVAGVALTPENIGIVSSVFFIGVTACYRIFKQFGITNAFLDWLLSLGDDPVTE